MVLAGNNASVHIGRHHGRVPFAVVAQLGVIVILAAAAAMLLFVGAFASGAVLAAAATLWFVRLYRRDS